jgi:hypothetical protein
MSSDQDTTLIADGFGLDVLVAAGHANRLRARALPPLWRKGRLSDHTLPGVVTDIGNLITNSESSFNLGSDLSGSTFCLSLSWSKGITVMRLQLPVRSP